MQTLTVCGACGHMVLGYGYKKPQCTLRGIIIKATHVHTLIFCRDACRHMLNTYIRLPQKREREREREREM